MRCDFPLSRAATAKSHSSPKVSSFQLRLVGHRDVRAGEKYEMCNLSQGAGPVGKRTEVRGWHESEIPQSGGDKKYCKIMIIGGIRRKLFGRRVPAAQHELDLWTQVGEANED